MYLAPLSFFPTEFLKDMAGSKPRVFERSKSGNLSSFLLS